jgi:hypothetical protein
MSFFRVASVGLLVLGACALPEENTSDVEQHLPHEPPGGCEEFGCGTNSPAVDNLGVHDLHGQVNGLPNANKFRIVKITNTAFPGVLFKQIFSKGGRLTVTNGVTTLTGAQVQNTSLIVETPLGATKYEIKIGDMGRTPYWAQLGGIQWATTYKMDWDIEALAPGQKRNWKNICTKPPAPNDPDLLGMDAFKVVVFELDEIDAAKKTVTQRRDVVTPGDSALWFNIGCAGHALAKLHLTGHTTAAGTAVGFHTTNKQRQATLKMIAADYCGTGYAFTVAGQKLYWLDENPYNTYPVGFVGKKEAEWTASGAACLNVPRVVQNPTAAGSAIFHTATVTDMLTDIKDVCGFVPPACATTDPADLNGNYIISSNP